MKKAKWYFFLFWFGLMLCLSINAFSQNQLVSGQIRTLIEGDSTYFNIAFDQYPLHSRTALISFYTERSFIPGWSENQQLTCNALELRHLIQNASFDGLLPEDYHLEGLNSFFEKYFSGIPLTPFELAKVDFLLSDAFILYANHIFGGKVHPEHLHNTWEILQKGNEPKVIEKLYLAVSENNVKKQLFSLQPKFAIYPRMRQSMKKYLELEKLISGKNWQKISPKESIEPLQENELIPSIRKRLQLWKDLKPYPLSSGEENIFDSLMLQGVRTFQERNGLHPDGVLGKATIEALNKSPQELIKQVSVNMERLRWLPDTTVQEFILVNIANYSLDYINKKDTLLHSNAIVEKNSRFQWDYELFGL